MSGSQPLILVDGSHYLYRAFYAMPNLQTSTGQPTGAIRGVVNMLLNLMHEYTQAPIAVIFDTAKPTFRHNMYEEYKATRPPMQDEMVQQIDLTYEAIRKLGLSVLMLDGFEADDIIGTLARRAEHSGQKVLIISSDKDLAQLVNDNVVLLDSMFDRSLDRKGVIEKFAVTPEQIIDFLTLTGDTSDNIPGVDKVGPKTAAKWLGEYGSLDNILEHKDQIKGKIGENLRAAVPHLDLSRKLVTIKCDVELGVELDDLARKPLDTEALTDMFEELEFRTLVRRLKELDGTAISKGLGSSYEIVTDQFTLNTWVDRIRQHGQIVLETHIRRTKTSVAGDVTGIAIATDEHRAAYVPLAHKDSEFRQLKSETVLTTLKPVLEDANIVKIGNGLKSTVKCLLASGIELKGEMWDTALMSYVLNSSAPGGHYSSALSSRHLQHTTIDAKTLVGSGVNQISLSEAPIPETAAYIGELVAVNVRVFPILRKQLEVLTKCLFVYSNIECPLLIALATIENNGVRLIREPIDQLSEELKVRAEELTTRAYELAGRPFGLNSPKQLQEVLYDELGLTAPRKTRTGTRSTSEEILRDLRSEHELPGVVLEYRAATKLKSTYTDQLGNYIHSTSGRVHTTYDQTNAITGRLASAGPNLQNIPIRTADGRRLREAFVAKEGSVLLAADYSQIELRIMAHLSGDQGLQEAFQAELDIHRATASEMFSVSYDAVTDEMRRQAKGINFGLIYGMGVFGLAQHLGIDRSVAKKFIENYFEHYPGVLRYMDTTKENARRHGFVETLFGRRIYLDDIQSSTAARRAYAERVSINAPMQGTAADIIKLATVAIDEFLAESTLDARMVLHVHDEIVFEVSHSQTEALQQSIVPVMQEVAELDVDLVVDVGVGANWREAH
ncbi:MAG: DNA polymerase I [Gammaproteobacteria bacterium]|nr:DNA polymerase I [Gammaproteobacteria bacterium]MYI76773.1 DNA polymerase I [Gammaproteobacteria bacterium]